MVVRRFVKLAVSFCLVLAIGITWVDPLFAQESQKRRLSLPRPRHPPPRSPRMPPSPTRPRPSQPRNGRVDENRGSQGDGSPAASDPAGSSGQARWPRARPWLKLIVAAQDAGLVETSIDPPPILDILITGRATDLRTLKNTTAKKPYAVSPEVFGAWFTGYGKTRGHQLRGGRSDHQPQRRPQAVVRLARRILEQYIQEIRKAKGPAPKKEESKPAETKKAEEPKKTDTPTKPAEPKKG